MKETPGRPACSQGTTGSMFAPSRAGPRWKAGCPVLEEGPAGGAPLRHFPGPTCAPCSQLSRQNRNRCPQLFLLLLSHLFRVTDQPFWEKWRFFKTLLSLCGLTSLSRTFRMQSRLSEALF